MLDIGKNLIEEAYLEGLNEMTTNQSVIVKENTKEIIETQTQAFMKKLSLEIVESIDKVLCINNEKNKENSVIVEILENTTTDNEAFFIGNNYKKIVIENIVISLLAFFCVDGPIDREIDMQNYISKKFPYFKAGNNNIKQKSLKLNNNELFKGQEKIIKIVTNLLKFLSNFSNFLGENIDLKNSKILSKKTREITIHDLKGVLILLTDIILNNKLEKDVLTYITKVIKILFIYLEFFVILHLKKDELITELFHKKHLFNDDIDDEVLNNHYVCHDLPSSIMFITYGLLELDTISLKVENIVFSDGFSNTFLSKFKNSEAKKKIEKVKGIENRNFLLKIVSKKEDFFIKGKNIPLNNLFNYLISDLSNKKHKYILDFFTTNTINYSEEELMFIFQNNLENSLIVKSFKFLQKTIVWKKNHISFKKIKKLNTEEFEILANIQNTKIIKHLIDYFLLDRKNYQKYQKYINLIDNLKNDIIFLHKSAEGYKELKNMSNTDFKDIDNIDIFILEIKKIYIEFNISGIILLNSELLSGENDNIKTLDDFYILFGLLDSKILEELLNHIYGLKQEDFNYIKKVLNGFQGENNDYNIFLYGGYINHILSNKDIVDLYLEEDENYSLSYLFEEIDEEINLKKNNKDIEKENILYSKIIKLYGKDESKILLEKFTNVNDLEFLIKIGKIINGYKLDFVLWIIKQKKIYSYNIENILSIFTFFYIRRISGFYNYKVEDVFNIAFNLDKKNERINFINDTFNKTKNIKNPEIFKQVVLEYLKNGDKKIINSYIKENLNKIDITSNNELDSFILRIVKNGTDKQKKKLGEYFSKSINIIKETFSTKFLSSKLNKSSGTGTGSSTNIFKQYLLRPLERNQNESYIHYLNRIYIINWKEIVNSKKGEDLGRKLTGNAQYSVQDINFLFFEALEKFKSILITYEKINQNIEISNLLNTYNRVYVSLIKKFKKENSLN